MKRKEKKRERNVFVVTYLTIRRIENSDHRLFSVMRLYEVKKKCKQIKEAAAKTRSKKDKRNRERNFISDFF